MNWLKRLMHRCEAPAFYPVTEEQRYWTCPECSRVWQWSVITDEGIGWSLL